MATDRATTCVAGHDVRRAAQVVVRRYYHHLPEDAGLSDRRHAEHLRATSYSTVSSLHVHGRIVAHSGSHLCKDANGTAGDNGTAGGTLNQSVLDFW